MDAPTLYAYSFAVTAQEGHLVANNIEMLNGSVTSVRNKDFPLATKGFLGFDAVSRNNYFGKSQYQLPEEGKEKRQTYRIDAKEVVITCFKDHNSVLLKDSDIFYNGHKIINGLDFEIIRDKQNQVSETNAPEAGNLRNFGFYAGYGKVFKLPQGQTLKLMPVLAYHKSDFGLGILGRYNTPKGRLDGGWNMASENLVVRGRYDFNNNLKFNYGRHAYMPEGFMGARRSGYAAQLHYQKSYRIKDLGATFSNGFYAGLFSDYSKKDQEDAFSTTRFRYMAQLRKNFYQYKN
ncbi:MAG: hypothetical protein IJW73_05090, partial [Candidatus Gastranaerophilales bacterium]|nr:hypothetical protein [Candidatus Gastranaerophilales bacterium]